MFFLLRIFIVFIACNNAIALNERNFINALLSNDKFFAKDKIDLEIKRVTMDGYKQKYSNWHWNINAELSYSSNNRNKDTNYVYAYKTSNNGSSIATNLTKKFFTNGSELSVYYDKRWMNKNEHKNRKGQHYKIIDTDSYIDIAGVSWSIPLLRNQDGVIDKKSYTIAKLNFIHEKLTLAEFKESFIAAKLVLFLDWISYYEQLNIVNKHIEAENNILTKIKQNGANSKAIAIMQNSIYKSQRELLYLQTKLKKYQEEIDGLFLGEYIYPLSLNWDFRTNLISDVTTYCEKNIRDIQRIEIDKIKNFHYIKVYENSQLAELNFSISAEKYKNLGNYSSYSTDKSSNNEVRLNFSYPLTGDVSNKTKVLKYKLKGEQLEIKYSDKLKYIVNNAQQLATQLSQGIKQINLYKTQIKQLRKNDENSELKDFLNGNGNIRFVIAELDEAKEILIDYIKTAIQYHKNRIAYDDLLDRLLI